MEHMNTLSDTASNDDPGTQYNNLEQMNTLFETASINYTGNHDDTLEQMNTLSETASNNDTGNHDDTLEQMNTLSETALTFDAVSDKVFMCSMVSAWLPVLKQSILTIQFICFPLVLLFL
jgi:hypothetical protein